MTQHPSCKRVIGVRSPSPAPKALMVERCSTCSESGYLPDGYWEECRDCDGTGWEIEPDPQRAPARMDAHGYSNTDSNSRRSDRMVNPDFKPKPALFAFYRDGQHLHTHSDIRVFEGWLSHSPWLYPPERCCVVKYEPTCTVAGDEVANPVIGDGLGIHNR